MLNNWVFNNEEELYDVYTSFWITKKESEIVRLCIKKDLSCFLLYCFENESHVQINKEEYDNFEIDSKSEDMDKQKIFKIANVIAKSFSKWNK